MSLKYEPSSELLCPYSREVGSGRALPTETKVEIGTSQSKSGTSVNLINRGLLPGSLFFRLQSAES